MAGIDPSDRYGNERDRIEASEQITDTERDAILGVLDTFDGRKEASTLTTYGNKLRLFASDTDADLTEQDVDTLETMLQEFVGPENRNYADGSITQAESALISWVRVHVGDDDADEIQLSRSDTTSSIDERTVLTPEEFHELRDSAGNMRNRALIDLIGYTGQRLRVIQNLKISDIDLDSGEWYMPDAEGLKGADKQGKKRPLLAARKSVSEWISMHPTGKPDDYLITCVMDNRSEFGDRLGGDAIRRQLRRIADRAGIDKPVNPHSFRHYFVTVCKVQYDMKDETIRHLIGHGPNSRVMETTYSHLDDDDHIREAREAFGIDNGDDPHTLTPPVCPTCSRPLPPDAKSCPTPTCSEVFTPEATEQSGLAQEIGRLDEESKDELIQQLKTL
jgi:integrase